MTLRDFVREYGAFVRADVLAYVLGIQAEEVRKIKAAGGTTRRKTPLEYSELFKAWHGRAPTDDEWPAPYKTGQGAYVWQAPELKLLATLVGTMSYEEIAKVLTTRLQLLTGDKAAERNKMAVTIAANRIGLVATDVVGGITVTDAGLEIGSTSVVHKAIEAGRLKARKVGRLWVIPHAEWARWKATVVKPPKGYVQLSSLRERLGIRSDSKLPEFASLGYIPTAIRCNPYGTSVKTTKYGSWFVKASVARKLLADRKAGLPMPWHGRPMPDNLKATWKRWQAVKHPPSCPSCKEIWGAKGAPKTLEDYMARYPGLQHGQKRHLTLPWSPGLTVEEVAAHAGSSSSAIKRALANGMLEATKIGRTWHVAKTEATRWKARGCPTGEGTRSFISLDRAMEEYGFTPTELRNEIRSGRIKGKVETSGPAAGQAFLVRQHCALYRQRVGFTEAHAAARAGVSVEHLRVLLRGVDWRMSKGDRIPLATLQAVIKRQKAAAGYTIPQAADAVGRSEAWVRAHIAGGTIKVKRAKWDRRRIYISQPQLERLRAAASQNASPARAAGADWMTSGPAAQEAGVTAATITRWAEEGSLKRKAQGRYWVYHRDAVRARATSYWDVHRKRRPRARPPSWYANATQFQDRGAERTLETAAVRRS